MNKLMEAGCQCGDIILSTNKTWLGNAIRGFESAWDISGKAEYSHALNVVTDGQVIESLDKIRVNPLNKYASKDCKIAVYRLELTDAQRVVFNDFLRTQVNRAYGWFKYPLFVLDTGFTQIGKLFKAKSPCYFFTKTFGISNFVVCSQLSGWALYKARGRNLTKNGKDVNWRTITPDVLQELFELPENGATLIYKAEYE